MINSKQIIYPHLWFDQEAKEAVNFYLSIFPDSKIIHEVELNNTPSGDVLFLQFQLWGKEFLAINGGPNFKFNPSISFMVNFDPARDENAETMIDEAWEKLSDGGKVLMEYGSYPFSKKYGWIEDKFGLTWQLMLTEPEGEERPTIIPYLLFVDSKYGKAEAAYEFYQSVFKKSRPGQLVRYPEGMAPNQAGTIMFSDVQLEDQWFVLMDSGHEHHFAFNEAISFLVLCGSQEEIDYYWDKLSADPGAEQCGWLKDQFGISWQIVPRAMLEMMREGTTEQINRVNQENLKMKKINLEALLRVYNE